MNLKILASLVLPFAQLKLNINILFSQLATSELCQYIDGASMLIAYWDCQQSYIVFFSLSQLNACYIADKEFNFTHAYVVI